MSYAKVQFYRDAGGEFRWRMRAPNNRIICEGAEGYKTRRGCRHGYEAVRTHFQEVTEETYHKTWKS